MKYDENAICTLVSNNFLAEGINCHKYLKIDNPKIRHFLFTIGEINIENIKNLKKHKNLFHISIESFIEKSLIEKMVKKYSPLEISFALRATCHKYVLQ